MVPMLSVGLIKEKEIMQTFDVEADYFFIQNVSINFATQQFLFDQVGPAGFGGGGALAMQWFFASWKSGNLFLRGGLGLQYTDMPVPNSGSKFNFSPRESIGFTQVITGQTRLVAGFRLNHLIGVDHGLPHTTPQLYLGLSIPFGSGR